LAYGQVKKLDKESEEKRRPKEEGALPEDEQEKPEEEKKVELPKQIPAISPETFRMIETIEKKNQEIKKREEELRIREQKLKALEQKVSQDLNKITEEIARSEQAFGAQDAKTKQNIDALIKVYSSMKPEQAANLIAAIDEDLALKIVSGMKSAIAAQVLSQLDVKVAKNISEKLAGKGKEKGMKPASNPGNQ